MTTFLDKLNLRPQERRWVVAIMAGVFIIINYALVWPYFSEWGKVHSQIDSAQFKVETYQREIKNDVTYKGILDKLDKQGPSIQLEGDIQLMKTIYAQAAASKVSVMGANQNNSKGSQTNEFFEEQSVKITVDAEEKDLVDFLYTIGGDSSMIRVRDLNLRPADNNRYRLRGMITLTANYQKKAEVKPAASTNKPPTTGRPTLVSTPKTPAAPAAPKKPGK